MTEVKGVTVVTVVTVVRVVAVVRLMTALTTVRVERVVTIVKAQRHGHSVENINLNTIHFCLVIYCSKRLL